MTDDRDDPAGTAASSRIAPPLTTVERRSAGRSVGRVSLGVLAIAAAARLAFPVPGSPVPQSAQTLAVALVGVWLGPGSGVVAVLGYLLVGSLGLPVFADGASGVARLVGPTGGYLAGFAVGAWTAGRVAGQGRAARIGLALVALLSAHAWILGLGWLRLSALIGPGPAWVQGVAPFVTGALLKSVAGAVAVFALARGRRASDSRPAG